MCLAVPGRLTDRWEISGMPMGSVSFGGTSTEACLAYVPDLRVGDYTIVHAGFALRRLDQASALETLSLLGSVDLSVTEGPGDSGRPA